MVFYLAAGLAAGIVASLLTRPVPETKPQNFYALLRTPVCPGEQVTAPCTLPASAVVPERHHLGPSRTLETPVPNRTAILGFPAGWACAGVLALALYVIAGL